MRIIAFITFSADIRKILEHIGVDPEAPRIPPARGPPLWEDCGEQETGEGVEAEPDFPVFSGRFTVRCMASCGWNAYPLPRWLLCV